MIGAIDVLKQDLKLFTNNWKKMMPYLLLLALPSFLLTILGFISAYLAYIFPASSLISTLIMLVIVVASMLFSFWITIAFTKFIYDIYTGKPIKSWKEYLNLGTHLIGPTILVSLLTSLIVLGGLILLIIPGIIFALWYVFATYVIILEDKKEVVASLKESKRLVSGRWWGILWKLFVPGLILGLSVMIINGLLAGITGILFKNIQVVQTVILMITSIVVGVIFSPLSIGMVLIVYSSARETKPEGSVEPMPELKQE